MELWIISLPPVLVVSLFLRAGARATDCLVGKGGLEVFHFLKTTQQTMMLSNMAACSFLKMKGYERKKFLRERRENRARNYPSNYYKSTELQGTIFLRTRCPVKV